MLPALSRLYRNKLHKNLSFSLFLTVPVKFIISTLDFHTDVLFVYRVKIREDESRVIKAGYFHVIVRVLIFRMELVLRFITRCFTKNGLSLTKG